MPAGKEIAASLALVSGKDERGMRRKTLSIVRHTCEDLHFRCIPRAWVRVFSHACLLPLLFYQSPLKNIKIFTADVCELTSSSQENRETVLSIIFLILSINISPTHIKENRKGTLKRELKQQRRRRQRPRRKIIIDLKKKQSLCTCVIILCRHPQNSNLECPNSRFCGEREHTTVNFFILLAGSLERRFYQFTNELK